MARQCAQRNSRNSDRNIILFRFWSGSGLISTLVLAGMSDVPSYRVTCHQSEIFLISPLDSAVTSSSKSITNSVKHGTNYCSTLYVSVKYRVMHGEVHNRSVTGGNKLIRNKPNIKFIVHLKSNFYFRIVVPGCKSIKPCARHMKLRASIRFYRFQADVQVVYCTERSFLQSLRNILSDNPQFLHTLFPKEMHKGGGDLHLNVMDSCWCSWIPVPVYRLQYNM